MSESKIAIRSLQELHSNSSSYDAVSINYFHCKIDVMSNFLKEIGLDSKQFNRPDLTLAHTKNKHVVFGHGDDKPLLITSSEPECSEDKIFMLNEVLKVADCERVKYLCVLQFLDLSLKDLAIDLKNCFRVLRQSQYWTKVGKIDVYVSSENYAQARNIYEEVMSGW